MAVQFQVSKGGFAAGAIPFLVLAAAPWFASVSLLGAVVITGISLASALVMGLVVGSEVIQWRRS